MPVEIGFNQGMETKIKKDSIHMGRQLGLKVVSPTFLLVSFLSVNESTYQTRKSVFYFTSKALSVLEKIKF